MEIDEPLHPLSIALANIIYESYGVMKTDRVSIHEIYWSRNLVMSILRFFSNASVNYHYQ